MLATLRPADDAERHAAERAVQAMWREMRADRLEAVILGELFAAGSLGDADAARAVREAGMKALSTLLRYRARIQRDIDRALHELDCLRERPAQAPATPRPSEPGDGLGSAQPPQRLAEPAAAGTSEPGAAPGANRHERRRLAALERRADRRAA